jgi:hypothetical protein
MFSITLLGGGFQRRTFVCASGLTSLQAGDHLTPTAYCNCSFQLVFPSAASSRAELTHKVKVKVMFDQWPVGQSILVSSTHLEPKTRFLLLSDSCGFVDVGRPLWREDGSVVYSCCWPSPAKSFLPRINSSGHFASRVLIQFLWWPLFCLLLTRPHWAVSCSTELWRDRPVHLRSAEDSKLAPYVASARTA